MANRLSASLVALVGLVTLCSCGSSSQFSTIAGTASVDGAPVEHGTIHFRSNDSSASSGGGAITDGQFQVESQEGFSPGQYEVVVQAFRKTGRIIHDPQKGQVEETRSTPLRDSPRTVTLNQNNSTNLALDFSWAQK